jgi:DNA-binding FrmR family transcriptional regulator
MSGGAEVGAEEIVKRLRRVEGQVRGLQRMVEEERDCEAIVTQLMAARAALDRVGLIILNDLVDKCLTTADGKVAQQRMGRVLALMFSRWSAPDPAEEPALDNSLEP